VSAAGGPTVIPDGLRCPICHAALDDVGAALACRGCATLHPVVRGVPVLLDEANSVFTVVEVSGVGPGAFDAGGGPACSSSAAEFSVEG